MDSATEDDWNAFKDDVIRALSSPREAVQARFELKKATQRADETVAQFGERLRDLRRFGYRSDNQAAMESALIDALSGGILRDEILRDEISIEYKLDRYSSLQTEIQAEGWCCYNVAVEVGARGVVAQSLERAARRIGFKGRELKKLGRLAPDSLCNVYATSMQQHKNTLCNVYAIIATSLHNEHSMHNPCTFSLCNVYATSLHSTI